jgi:hypothetical protein
MVLFHDVFWRIYLSQNKRILSFLCNVFFISFFHLLFLHFFPYEFITEVFLCLNSSSLILWILLKNIIDALSVLLRLFIVRHLFQVIIHLSQSSLFLTGFPTFLAGIFLLVANLSKKISKSSPVNTINAICSPLKHL